MSEQNQHPFLPTGWVTARLEEITFRIADGSHAPPPKQKSGFPMLSARNIEDGQIKFDNFRYISPKDFQIEDERTQVRPGDVLLTIVGTIGRTAVVPTGIKPFALQRSVAVIKPIRVLPKFLMHFFESPATQKRLSELAKGTAQKGVYLNTLSDLEILIAPLAEQQRIVDEIEKQFSRLDAAVEMLQRVERNLERLRAATLKAAVEGRLVPTEAELARAEGRDYEPADVLLQRILRDRRAKWEADQLAKMKEQGKTPKDDKWKSRYKEPVSPDKNQLPELSNGWTWASVDQLASFEPNSLTDGPFGSNLKTSHYTAKGPRVIRLQNIGDGYFIDEHAHISGEHFQALKKHQIFAGDIVIASLGEIAPRACIVPPSVGKAIVKADCIRFNPNNNIAVTEYLNYALNSEPTRERTTSFIHGVGRPRLGLGGIREIALPLPPVQEQRRIVAEVERRTSVIEELRKLVANALRRAAVLRQKILRDAFAGKLVPQDPTDEPVSLLLERIRAERVEREAEVRRARKERRGKMKGRKAKPSERKPRRPLREVVAESKRRLTPEQLFTEAGFTPEVVEDFYEELRREIKTGYIEQVRPNNAKVYLITANA